MTLGSNQYNPPKDNGGFKNKTVSDREVKGYAIISKGDIPKTVNEEIFLVPSQSSNKKYRVIVRNSYSCECPDHKYRKVKCKHIHAVEFLLKMRNKFSDSLDIPKTIFQDLRCIYCSSANLKKNGNRKTYSRIKQRYLCKDCKQTFIEDKEFEKIKADPKVVTLAMDLYYKGLSLRDISDTVKQFYGLEVSYEAVRNWITKFTQLTNDYVNKLQPKFSSTWHTDEQMIKVKGKWLYNWNVLDADTRFLIASNITKGRDINDARKVFRKTKKIASENPDNIVTDGLWSYEKAIKKEFMPHRSTTEHIRLTTIREKPNNNLVERYHNTFREFDKVRRGFKEKFTDLEKANEFIEFYKELHPKFRFKLIEIPNSH
ncbi:MAG: IS6 family transposase [Candidatus Aenigmarchaeota archaeon]|nr:IS6 family transposase [Candidatus Aenigmarchaeota archaeon]